MREELLAVLSDARTNAEVRALVLTGAGKGFCTGADLSRRGGGPTGPGAAREMMRTRSQRLIRALWELEKPVVAAVNGVAAGLGAHLAFASDLVIAAADARFIEVFVRRGIAVDGGGAYLLPRLIERAQAWEVLFFGYDLSAELINGVGTSEASSSVSDSTRLLKPHMFSHEQIAEKHDKDCFIIGITLTDEI